MTSQHSGNDPRLGPGDGPKLKTIIKINGMLLYACFLGGVAWLLWPETAEGWGYGVTSLFCGLAGAALAVRGFGEIWRYIANDIKVNRFKRQGREPHSDRLAGDDAMDNADMFE